VLLGTHDPENHTLNPAPIYDLKAWAHPTKETYKEYTIYPNTKLANALYGNELANRFQSSNIHITIATYDPGFIGTTGLLRNLGLIQMVAETPLNLALKFTSWWYGSPSQIGNMSVSSEYLAKLAVNEALLRETGRYYSVDKMQKCSNVASDTDKQRELSVFCRKLVTDAGFTLS
jgi:NAD(P)-dependent dehydrogenase (short-subunit alcohol dehydrogenase family)